jgi:methyltransferase (TIGR00027 family)
VLNLAAGLDARPWRMPLAPALRWIDADLPAILDYKQRTLAAERPVCDYRAVAIDLRERDRRRALFAEVASRSRKTLVITEGLLIYLDPADVRALADDLHAPASFRWWLMDIASPRILQILTKRWGARLEAGNAPFKFGPEESTAFFTPSGWREVEFRSSWTESFRLKRTMPGAWMWQLLTLITSPRRRAQGQRMSGIALLERA